MYSSPPRVRDDALARARKEVLQKEPPGQNTYRFEWPACCLAMLLTCFSCGAGTSTKVEGPRTEGHLRLSLFYSNLKPFNFRKKLEVIKRVIKKSWRKTSQFYSSGGTQKSLLTMRSMICGQDHCFAGAKPFILFTTFYLLLITSFFSLLTW